MSKTIDLVLFLNGIPVATVELTLDFNPGVGEVQEKQKALLDEIIAQVNDLFEGELTDDDKLVYVNSVIKGKCYSI